MLLCTVAPLFPLLASLTTVAPPDLREAYDVQAYDLELAVRPDTKTLEGLASLSAVAVEELGVVQIDLFSLHEVERVEDEAGRALEFERIENGLLATLPTSLAAGESFEVRIRYRGQPTGRGFSGFHWEESADGRPWIGTSCQGTGAHLWFPCKASFFHPEDKPARVAMSITCPADLVAVSNGRLVEERAGAPAWFDAGDEEWRTFCWRHDYPLETYTVTLNVGPYVHVEDELDVPGLDEPVPFHYWVLPENAERAALQFQDVPRLVEVFSEAFGPFPFPDSKFALVETSFWGMEHSTAVAYGSSYPAWLAREGGSDPYARRNRRFDFILVHEVAHEWWGNAVSARDWGHFWIHEGFATYAEGVYVERTQGRGEADRYFAETARGISSRRGSLYRGEQPSSREAYSGLLYTKGACVLNTLRHYVDDDELWWRALREFNLRNRYGNVDTEDFQALLEEVTEREWGRFFREWVYGSGTPRLSGEVEVTEKTIRIEIDNSHGSFLVPLDLAWSERGEARSRRLWVEPGEQELRIECEHRPEGVSVVHLDRLLGRHEIETD